MTATVVAAVVKFRAVGKSNEEPLPATSCEPLNQAEKIWVKVAQESLKVSTRYTIWKSQCWTDDQLIRCRGRLKNAVIHYSARFPLLLPREHQFTRLLIKKSHEDVFHNGSKETLCKFV